MNDVFTQEFGIRYKRKGKKEWLILRCPFCELSGAVFNRKQIMEFIQKHTEAHGLPHTPDTGPRGKSIHAES